MSRISVIVPMRDEACRLALHLPDLLQWCRLREAEIVLCDDGSVDGSLSLAMSMAAAAGVESRGLALGRKGKGAAVASGIMEARGDVLAMVDADFPLPPRDLDRILEPVLGGAAMCIGIRGSERSGSATSRRILSKVSSWVSRLLLGGIEDSQCGCKAWSAPVARRLCSARRVDGFAFDFEMLHLARGMRIPVDRIEIEWNHREGSHLHPVRHGTRFLLDMAGILLRSLSSIDRGELRSTGRSPVALRLGIR